MKKLLLGLKKAHGHALRIGRKVLVGVSSGLRLGGKAVARVQDASNQVEGLVNQAAPILTLVGGDRAAAGLNRVRAVNSGVQNVAGLVGSGINSGNLIVRQSQGVLNNPATVMMAARAIQTNAALGRSSLTDAYREARRIV